MRLSMVITGFATGMLLTGRFHAWFPLEGDEHASINRLVLIYCPLAAVMYFIAAVLWMQGN